MLEGRGEARPDASEVGDQPDVVGRDPVICPDLVSLSSVEQDQARCRVDGTPEDVERRRRDVATGARSAGGDGERAERRQLAQEVRAGSAVGLDHGVDNVGLSYLRPPSARTLGRAASVDPWRTEVCRVTADVGWTLSEEERLLQ